LPGAGRRAVVGRVGVRLPALALARVLHGRDCLRRQRRRGRQHLLHLCLLASACVRPEGAVLRAGRTEFDHLLQQRPSAQPWRGQA